MVFNHNVLETAIGLSLYSYEYGNYELLEEDETLEEFKNKASNDKHYTELLNSIAENSPDGRVIYYLNHALSDMPKVAMVSTASALSDISLDHILATDLETKIRISSWLEERR